MTKVPSRFLSCRWLWALGLPFLVVLSIYVVAAFTQREHTLAPDLAALIAGSADASPAEQAAPQAKGAPNEERPRIPAPELDGGISWLNTAGPLRIRDLRGKIVLLDFWTLCCINCIHTLPDLARLEKKYANQLVVIGVHSAKFENEKNSESIRKAILRYEIEEKQPRKASLH